MQTKYLLLAATFITSISCTSNNEKHYNAANSAPVISESLPSVKSSSAERIYTILDSAIYTKEDSIQVEKRLKEKVDGNLMLHYARSFIGVPYVAATLEKSSKELLVVNLRQLDCTTLVETCMALSMTKSAGSTRFVDYCNNLKKVRYRNGIMNGYLSRLHYFTWWFHDNLEKGIIEEVTDSKNFTAVMRVNLYYMSANPDKYKFLKGNKERIDTIATWEKQSNGVDGTYLAESLTKLPKSVLSNIESGDIVAIVSTKKGIDYSHLGIAVWGKDNKLHLLNASSIHHKVVEEPKTLYTYLKEHPSSIGIRLFRLRQ